MHCVFVLDTEDLESTSMVGREGKGYAEFRSPAATVADDARNMIVVDTRNHRLQLVQDDGTWLAMVKPASGSPSPYARPCAAFLDTDLRELYVCNKLAKSVVRCKLA